MHKDRFFEDVKAEVLDRDNHSCTICGRGANLPARWLSVERVFYWAGDDPDNLVTMCATRKGLCGER